MSWSDLEQNHTHEKNEGHNSNIFLTFTDELEKQIEVGQKKQNNFNIYNAAFF